MGHFGASASFLTLFIYLKPMAERRNLSDIKKDTQSQPKLTNMKLVSDTAKNLNLEKQKELNELLLKAVKNEKFADVKRLLKAGVNIKVLLYTDDKVSSYPKLMAAQKNDPELEELLKKAALTMTGAFFNEVHIYHLLDAESEIFISKFNDCIK